MDTTTAIDLHAAALRRKNRSPRTIEFYAYWLHALEAFTNSADLESITLAHLRAWSDLLALKQLSPGSIRGAAMTAKVFFKWCTREGLITSNPAERLELPQRPRRIPTALSTSDVLTVINCVQQHSRNPIRDTALIVFMVETGVRRSELITLTPDDVHVPEGYAVVVGKGNKQRWVFFGEATTQTVTKWLQIRPGQTHNLWGIKESGLRAILRRIATKTGLKLHPHLFRRTSATLRAASGANATDLQLQFGWESVEMANSYVQRAQLQQRAAAQAPLRGVLLPGATA